MPELARIIELADALVTDLNGAGLSPAFTAVRAYQVAHELPELKTLRVLVVPVEVEPKDGARGLACDGLTIDIGVLCKPPDLANATLDPYALLAQKIADRYRGAREVGGLQTTASRVRTLFLQDHLQRFGQFTAVVSVTFNAWFEI